MIIFATLRIAVRALKRNALRTLLTMLGIIIGVGAVIAMVSIGNGAKARVEASIANLGQNVIQVFSGNMSRGNFRMGFGSSATLKLEDYDAVRDEVTGITGISPEVRGSSQVAAGSQNHFPEVRGISADFLNIRSWPLEAGQNFTDAEIRNASKVALIGQTAAEVLFPDTDPIGQIIRIKNVPFAIIGMLKRKGMSMWGSDQDDVIYVPYTSAMKRLTGETALSRFNVQAAHADLMPTVQTQIVELLRQRHKIGPDKEDDFVVRTQQEITEAATETSNIMTALLGSIAGVSLLVGGIGIMNIMLVSVTERTREIGIRLAIGARGRDILLQFLIEAVTLSIVGGLIGIGMGIGTSRIISAKLGWATMVSTESVLLAFVFSAAIGIFFGFYPARKASNLDPIDALRYE